MPLRTTATRSLGPAPRSDWMTMVMPKARSPDPFNVLVQGLYRSLPWPEWMSHGRVHLLVSLLIVLALLAVGRSYRVCPSASWLLLPLLAQLLQLLAGQLRLPQAGPGRPV